MACNTVSNPGESKSFCIAKGIMWVWDGCIRPIWLTRLRERLTRENSASLLLSPPTILAIVFFGLITQAGFFMDALRVSIFVVFLDNLLMRKDIVGESSSSVKLTHIRHVRSGTFQSSGYNYFYVGKQQVFVPIWSQASMLWRAVAAGMWMFAKAPTTASPASVPATTEGPATCFDTTRLNSVRENFLYRNITRVSKCKRRSYYVTWRMCASAREDLIT